MKAIWMSTRGEDVLRQVYNEEDRRQLEQELDFVATITDPEQLELPDVKDVNYIFSTWGMLELTREQIRVYLPQLKAVFYGAGSVQSFARPFLEEGVRVFSSATANAVPVAEYTVAQIVLACKGFYQAARLYKEGRHNEARDFSEAHPGAYDTVIGLIGAGQIGRLVIQMLKAYHVRVKVFDPFLQDEQANALGVEKTSLEDLFTTCTVISNHLANNPQTVGMLNGKLFDLMQPYATFINTGRGAQVVEADLVEALQNEPGRTAVLDVTLPEPVEEGHPFYGLPNVILTPHIAGSMQQECARMGHYQMLEFHRVLRGETPALEVTLDMLRTMA
ncbi:MAG: hydroxyacid dehydrogenase [Clostridiales bacterium]|nr:hydroxyacid dehydrogenase [Clostridiales bacterium]